MDNNKKAFCSLFLILLVRFSYGQNLYQTCTNQLDAEYFSYSAYFDFDLGNASLPHDQAYTTTLRSGATVHFNICAGTSLCDGSMACIVQNGIVLSYASPAYAGYYNAAYAPTVDNVQLYFDSTGDQDFFLNVTCDYELPPPYYFRILNASLDGGQLIVNASSIYACAISDNLVYFPPTYYNSFSAPIYMQGRIPFFLQDVLTSLTSEFIGTLYYSNEYGVVINGTMTNTTSGESHFVAFYYVVKLPFNPPTLFNYVLHEGSSASACYNLGNTNYYAQDIFSASYNSFISVDRVYTSIYFEKGTSFDVTSYTSTSSQNVITILQRVSDGLPVFLGVPLISPWADFREVGAFVSELDWNNIQSSPLSPDTFVPPPSLACLVA